MDRSQEHGFSVGFQAGRLEGVALPDLLWAFYRARKTGLLRFEYKQVCKTIYLDDGEIVFASSNNRDDRLGEQLLRQGTITLAELEQAVSRIDSGKRIGTLLVEIGALSPENLVDGVVDQVKRITLELFAWEEGEYHFEEGPLPSDEVITLNMSTGELLLSGIRGIRSFARIRRSVGTPRTMYRMCDNWRESLEGVRLSEGEELLVARLEQADESVEGLCREVFLSNYEIYQTLWGLKVVGAIEEKSSLAESSEADWQGSLADTHFADVLIRAGHQRETGILHVFRRMNERTFHFLDGRCVFATSNNHDDGMIAYLLRRGVISLSDREETAKRLLSNKRVGTILRELGVIDDRDLDQMVRQQLCEIVYETFRWDEGDFAFYVGELPSNEEITLETSIESLVAEGIRRVASWSRVMEGCGGVDQCLSLSEKYLDVLDGLDAGAEEWQVVNAIKGALPAREIAANVELSDFRVCQILWTLRVLDALDSSPLRSHVVQESQPVESIPVDVVDLDRPALTAEPAGDPVAVHVSEPEVEAAIEKDEETSEPVVEQHADEIEIQSDFDDETPTKIPVRAEFDEPDDRYDLGADESRNEESIDDPHLRTLEDSTRTMRLSRDEVDAALNSPPPDIAAEELDAWEPPSDLDRTISLFNTMQRLIYRTVRSEVGAGAANFIRACGPEATPNPIEDTELQSDGTWDSEGLRRQVLENRIEDPWELYRDLIDRELVVLRAHIGEAKIVELQREVDKVSPG